MVLPGISFPAVASSSGSVTAPDPELLYLFYRYLETRGESGRRLADGLRNELDNGRLLPDRIDINGTLRRKTFREFEASIRPLVDGGLLRRVFGVLSTQCSQLVSNLRPSISVLTASKLCTKKSLKSDSGRTLAPFRTCSSLALNRVNAGNIEHLLRRRQFLGGRQSLPRHHVNFNYLPHTRVLGHLSPVFCVTFDRTGKYIFTGADDALVKLWRVEDARLVFTFRASSGEIADLSVSHENTLLAAGSVDKLVRVWCLRTGSLQAVLQGHSSMVTAVLFLQPMHTDDRYLVSTGNECNVCFWKWDANTLQFDTTPIKFNERTNASAQMVCMCSSPGGTLVATGATDHCIRIYRIDEKEGPIHAHEVEAHTDRVDSLGWCHEGLRFISGSKDGFAKIWRYERQQWHSIQLNVADGNNESLSTIAASSKQKRTSVCMVCWSNDDMLVVTSASDATIRIWNSFNGHFVRQLVGHTDETYILQAHPLNSDVVMSAGHDGLLIVWQLSTGKVLSKNDNHIEGSGHGSFFDAAISPISDQSMHIAAVDSHGHLKIMGINTNEKVKSVTSEQFFHTDYRPVVRDAAGYVLDEQTQLAPNLMPPPFLVNANGEPWPADHQRQVPGKEKCTQAFLQPHVVRPTDDPWVAIIVDGDSSASSSNSAEGTPTNNNSNGDSVDAARATTSRDDSCVCVWAQGRLMVPSLSDTHRNMIIQECEERARAERQSCEVEANREPLHRVSLSEPNPSPSRRSTRLGRGGGGGGRAENDRERNGGHSHELMLVPRERTQRRRLQRGDGSWQRIDDSQDDEASRDPINLSSGSVDGGSDLGGSSDSSDSDTSDTDYEDTYADSRRSRTRASSEINGELADLNDNEPSTSTAPDKPTRRRSSPAKRKNKRRMHSDDGPDADALYLQSFPGHMFNVELIRFPYFPQIGDDIVYFRLGHEAYLRHVEQHRLFPVARKMYPKPEFDAEEFAKVLQVRYVLQPYRLCVVRLAQIHWKTGRPSGFEYTIKYHDMDGTLDFMILRQHYEKSLLPKYKPGDRIRAMIDNQWWCGHIDKKEPSDPSFPRAHWQSVIIRWDSGEDERLSPWEMEPLHSNARSKTKATKNDERVRAYYKPTESDWPGEASPADNSEVECQRLESAIEMLSVMDDVSVFVNPVDLSLYPTYPALVAYPMDLQTIRHRIQNQFYRRQRAIRWDVQQLLLNAIAFNEPNSAIVRNAKVLVETLLRFIDDNRNNDVLGLYDRVNNMDDKDMTLCYQTIEQNTAEKQAKKEKGSGKQSDATWLQDCVDVMENIMQSQYAQPFLTNNTQELSDVYDTCLDLPSIVERLHANDYQTPIALRQDVDNLMQNCRRLATNKRSPLYQASLRVQAMFNEQMEPVLERWQRHTDAAHQSTSGMGVNGHGSSERRHGLRHRKSRHEYNTRSAETADSSRRSSRVRYSPAVMSPPPSSMAKPRSSSSRDKRSASKMSSDDEDGIVLIRPKQPRLANGHGHASSSHLNGHSAHSNGGGGRDRRSTRHGGKRHRPVVDYRDDSDVDDDEQVDQVSRSGRPRRPTRRVDY